MARSLSSSRRCVLADLTAIRRGIAAQLRDVLPVDEGQVFPWLQESPPTPCLQVAGLDSDGAVSLTFGDAKQYVVLVEGCLGLVADTNAQQRLDDWLSTDAIADAVEDANSPTGALTSRLQDDGTVVTGQAAAADSVGFDGYRGQTRFPAQDGRVLLLATWAFKVLT